jgi:uncharacterized secreted repeat protein (TIGR03808 family)
MQLDRRSILGAGIGAGVLTATAASATPRSAPAHYPHALHATASGLRTDTASDQTATFERALAAAAGTGQALLLPPGRIILGRVGLPPNTHLIGVHGKSILVFAGKDAGFTATPAPNLRLEGLVLDGASSTRNGPHNGLIVANDIPDAHFAGLQIKNTATNAIHLTRCGGRITGSAIRGVAHAGIFSIDATGLLIDANTVTDCANNGILVWRSKVDHDGTIVTANRISHIRTEAGGSGQNGNGVNVYRAGDVSVTNNHITHCAYSAIRANSASNVTISSNTCLRIGEVALYAEFGFQGAVITSNLVDHAATGIVATNFNEGGRLTVIQGNLVRNLFRREHEPVDKRGVGIAVEADASVSGNTIESAPTAGVIVGWGKWMRNIVLNGNMIKDTGIAIAITGDAAAGGALIASNMIVNAQHGAIRAMRFTTPHGSDLASRDGQTGAIRTYANMAL